jgi:hypothetical protein
MSLLDWTKSETISAPDKITIAWKSEPVGNQQPEEKTQLLLSTTKSSSTSSYQVLSYIDREGSRKTQDVQVSKRDVKVTTRASVNPEYVSARLKFNRGLPSGNDEEISETRYEYRTSVDGPILFRETTEVSITGISLAGQLQGIPYWWTVLSGLLFSPFYYDPPSSLYLSQRTIVEYEQAKGADGRDFTRTKTSRWIALGLSSEGKSSFERWMKAVKDLNIASSTRINDAISRYSELVFQGAEVQVSIGRAPVPSKPSDSELAGSEVTNGVDIPPGATPTEVFGNDRGWPAYVPPTADWQDFNRDSTGNGLPDWAPFVPQTFEDYNVDTSGNGVPDWADYVPPSVDWQDFNQDTTDNGVPDWAAYVPPSVDWQDYDLDSNGDGVPDWAAYVPPAIDWQDINTDSGSTGIPDWAEYIPPSVDWQDFNVDTSNNGVPDWAAYVPPAIDWEDVNVDSNSNGVPDWASFLPPGEDWQDYVTDPSDPLNTAIDANSDGIPDWADFLPSGNWQDFVTDPIDWQSTAIDTNNDGIPDWADLLPSGNWQDYVTDPSDPFNTFIDSNGDGVPDWASTLPSGNWQDFVTDPLDWQNTFIDTDNDGIPDWAQNLPSGNWQDYVVDPINWQSTPIDSNGNGIPDWADNLPSGNWQDYVTDPSDPFNTAIDSNGDGIPDWADNTPFGFEDFNTDTTYFNPEPEVNNDKSITGQVVFDGQSYNDNDPTVTATYAMPYAPDDYFYYDKRIRKLYRSNARAAAEKFGQTEAALDIGHSFGQNIVSGFNETPTLDLSPVYIRLAGIEGAFLLDAVSYAWGPEGMVVSSDLMLIGVTGYDGASAPATSWLRLPVAPSAIGPAGGTTVEASPVKANSINIPGGFDVRNLSSVFTALPTNGADVFKEWRSNVTLVQPTLTLERFTVAAGPSLRVVEVEYELDAGTDEDVLAAGPFVDGTDILIDPYSRLIVERTAAPVLGAGQVSPTTAATDDGWQLIFNSAADEGATQTGNFGFEFTLSNVAYATCYVNSNGYITFGGTSNQYVNLGESVPSLPKLHVGSGDFSYQRVYTKVGTDEFRIRWEGNSDFAAGAGNSNRFHEVTFYSPNGDGSQWLEVRTGNVAGSVAGPLMLATATTALASGTFAANQSWVFEGNAAGTTWTVASGKHVQPPLAVIIAAPAATLTISALAPEVAISTVVDVPAAVVTITGLAPVVATSDLVDVPLASIALTGLAPTASTAAPTSDYWSDWVLQNYGWDSDLYPDWWAD